MTTGAMLAVKMALRGLGISNSDFDAMEQKVQQGAAMLQGYDLDELRAAMQMILDYKRDRIINELRMKAIMSSLGIADPAEIDFAGLLQQTDEKE